jgi:hypothetical protein
MKRLIVRLGEGVMDGVNVAGCVGVVATVGWAVGFEEHPNNRNTQTAITNKLPTTLPQKGEKYLVLTLITESVLSI